MNYHIEHYTGGKSNIFLVNCKCRSEVKPKLDNIQFACFKL